jgi:hypothetical protein
MDIIKELRLRTKGIKEEVHGEKQDRKNQATVKEGDGRMNTEQRNELGSKKRSK